MDRDLQGRREPGRSGNRSITLPVLKFGEDRGFEAELHRKVDAYFESSRVPRTAPAEVYVKVFLVVVFSAAMYLLLVFEARTVWQGMVCAILLGFAVVEIGVNLQHDGSHSAFSKHRWVNKALALTADLIGASSYFWHWKHNRFHHTFTNIARFDTDIDLGILARVAPSAKRQWFHRWQHCYIWLFYCLLVIKWQLFDDFYNLLKGRLGNHAIPRPKGMDLIVFVLGKVAFFSLAFGIPLLFHSVGRVFFFYGLTMIVAGLTLSLIFILPHAVVESEFPVPDKETGRIGYPRAVHQVRVTVDFMRNNPVVSRLVGSLNYHREHHLFPGVCHVHYKQIYGIIDEVCEKYGVRHVEHTSYAAGLRSHYRWLRQMGRA